MKKRMLSLISAAILILTVSACQSKPAETPAATTAAATTAAATGKTESAAMPEQQAAAENNFYDKIDVVEMIIPFAAGGGGDVTGRFMAQYIAKYLGSNIQCVNVPGGGSMIGSNEFMKIREHDGTNLLSGTLSVTFPPVLERDVAEFSLDDFIPIMSVPGNSILYISTKTGYKEPKDILNLELAIPGSDLTGSGMMNTLCWEVLGNSENVKTVYGYDSSSARLMGIQQDEVDMNNDSTADYLKNVKPLVEEGIVVPMFQMGYLQNDGSITRDPLVPEIPTFVEYYTSVHDSEPSGEIFDAWKFFATCLPGTTRNIYVHADAPEEAIKALKEAAVKAAADPDFKAQQLEILASDTVYVGEECDAKNEQRKALTNPDIVNSVKKLLVEKYGAEGLTYTP